VRSYEPEEKERLDRLGVRVFYIEEVGRRGLDTVCDEA
jgi:arginase